MTAGIPPSVGHTKERGSNERTTAMSGVITPEKLTTRMCHALGAVPRGDVESLTEMLRTALAETRSAAIRRLGANCGYACGRTDRMRVTLTGGAPPVGRATQPQLANRRRDTDARGPTVAKTSARSENLDPHFSLFFAGDLAAQSL